MNEAIITDVTRMHRPKVCIAALQGGRTIRLNRPQPDEQVLKSIGGLLPGDRVCMEWLDNPFYVPPHVEDGTWEPMSFRKLERLSKTELMCSCRGQLEASRKRSGTSGLEAREAMVPSGPGRALAHSPQSSPETSGSTSGFRVSAWISRMPAANGRWCHSKPYPCGVTKCYAWIVSQLPPASLASISTFEMSSGAGRYFCVSG